MELPTLYNTVTEMCAVHPAQSRSDSSSVACIQLMPSTYVESKACVAGQRRLCGRLAEAGRSSPEARIWRLRESQLAEARATLCST